VIVFTLLLKLLYEICLDVLAIKWKKHHLVFNLNKNTSVYVFYLFQLGLKPCHGVGILGFNAPEWFISYIGAIFAG
jgi:hypothetical protein